MTKKERKKETKIEIVSSKSCIEDEKKYDL